MRISHPYKAGVFHRTSSIQEPNQLLSILKQHPLLCDLILCSLIAGLTYGFCSYFRHFFSARESHVDIDLSPWHLPQYAFYSMSRGLLGYMLSLLFSLIWGFWTAKDRFAERVLIPVLDVLQSIPILGFMPGLVLSLVDLFPTSNKGLEMAAIAMVFTSQAWNMAFSVYHSIRVVPQDKLDCAKVYRFSTWQKIRWVEFPYTIISLVWNSMMSMAGGWFFLVVTESFKLGSRDFRLPGLGSYMSVAAARGDLFAMFWAMMAMIGLIIFLDSFLWKPLIAWSQKFRVEETGSSMQTESLFFHILNHSLLLGKMRRAIHQLKARQKYRKAQHTSTGASSAAISRICLLLLIALSSVGLFFLLRQILAVSFNQWGHLVYLALLTLSRVCCCILLGTLIALPLGLWMGLSETLSKRLEPIVQVAASFPATLFFPIFILLFQKIHLPLSLGSIFLMLMGTVWYILFNVLAGTKAMPSDLKEATTAFRIQIWQRLWKVYIPSIFPYLVTGLLSAAGGAWNASIVAEYISYKQQIYTVPGLGSSISLSAQNGDIPLLIASIFTMAVVVVVLNYQVWLKLYHYSEKRFSLNY